MEITQSNPIERLSARESEVLELIQSGLAREQIAISMSISKLTYDSYRKSIRTKLDIKNQSDWARVLFLFSVQNHQKK